MENRGVVRVQLRKKGGRKLWIYKELRRKISKQ